MTQFTLSQKALQVLRQKASEREISQRLLAQEKLIRLIELGAQYTKNSDNALVYLELPLESEEAPDVQFCLTECLQVPDLPQQALAKHQKLLTYAEKAGERVGADFAFDAAYDYAAAPCLYAYLPAYAPELADQFFAAVDAPAYGALCREIIAKAPADYHTYYLGLMQSRQPAYARIGFRHTRAEHRYQQDISSFVHDLQALGYDQPLSAKMQQELTEAAQFGFLQDTQLSVFADGHFADRLAMDSVYDFSSKNYPALNLIRDASAREKVAGELAKCCFAVLTRGLDAQGRRRMVVLRSFIQYVKCTWVNGEKGPLKAYLALSAQVCY